MEELQSKFNINFVREVYLVGDSEQAEIIKKAIKGYYYLVPREMKELGHYSEEAHFVVAIADYSTPEAMQAVARMFSAAAAPGAHKIIYVAKPATVTRAQLLFSQEVGARYVCSGPARADEIKEYLKRVCVEAHQVGSLAALENELETAFIARDRAGLQRTTDKLRAIPGESEEGLRLLAVGSLYLNDMKRAEAYLKRLLAINPQNLWAANTLGKSYLRNGRAAQGMEVLQRISMFHELNSERLLELGNAQAVAGKTSEAEASLKRGEALAGGDDARFKEGMAKVKLAQRDLDGALGILGDKGFSEDVLSFLNMRAIMAIRGQKYEEGIDYYAYALSGAGADNDIKAKIKFNMGLAYARTGNLDKAQLCLRESCELGGSRFQRAKGPLDKVSAIIKSRGKKKPEDEGVVLEEEAEWETLF